MTFLMRKHVLYITPHTDSISLSSAYCFEYKINLIFSNLLDLFLRKSGKECEHNRDDLMMQLPDFSALRAFKILAYKNEK